jgi:hypothetical protein
MAVHESGQDSVNNEGDNGTGNTPGAEESYATPQQTSGKLPSQLNTNVGQINTETQEFHQRLLQAAHILATGAIRAAQKIRDNAKAGPDQSGPGPFLFPNLTPKAVTE